MKKLYGFKLLISVLSILFILSILHYNSLYHIERNDQDIHKSIQIALSEKGINNDCIPIEMGIVDEVKEYFFQSFYSKNNSFYGVAVMEMGFNKKLKLKFICYTEQDKIHPPQFTPMKIKGIEYILVYGIGLLDGHICIPTHGASTELAIEINEEKLYLNIYEGNKIPYIEEDIKMYASTGEEVPILFPEKSTVSMGIVYF